MSSAFQKFLLLLWKNWKLQSRHRFKTVVEIVLPILLASLLLLIRYYSYVYTSEGSIKPAVDVTTFKVEEKCSYNEDCFGRSKNWSVAYFPKGNAYKSIMEKVKYKLGVDINGLGFDSEEEMVKFINKNRTKKDDRIFGGVVFSEDTHDKIQIKIRLPFKPRGYYYVDTWLTSTLYPVYDFPGPRESDRPGYVNGFLALQHALSEAVREVADNGNNIKVNVDMKRFPYPPYEMDSATEIVKIFLPLILYISFLYPVVDIAKSVVEEKEKRLKESMKMMGLSNWLHWSAWFTKALLLMLIPVIVISVILCAHILPGDRPAVLRNSSFLVIFIFMLLFVVCSICFAFFISVLFSKARTASVVCSILWIVTSQLYQYTSKHYLTMSRSVKMLSCLVHLNGMSYGCQIILMNELSGVGNYFSTFNEYASVDDNITLLDVCGMFIAASLIFLFLTWYIESVFPGEFGVPQRWYFLFTKHYWCPWKVQSSEKLKDENNYVDKSLFEEEPLLNPGIQIKSISKVYKKGKPPAVNNMNLNIYEGQITALLGHNGAGKTTTMSILTGLYPPTAGTAIIDGYDITTNMHSIRSSLGLCPQHNVLFDEMTVEEHLYFFCKLKGMESSTVQEEIDKYIEALELQDKRNTFSAKLSGGMKRKLSVVIALCGGSKIVMLDEPTSGMDPQARRAIWDLLMEERADRTILLTTHFMEEADLLGDRIAIMAEGKVHCCGSSLFLKKKFGAGYRLVIVKDNGCNVNQVTAMLQKHVSSAELDQNIGAEVIYLLPEIESRNFPAMFTDMDETKNRLRISSYGLSHTTMEEVFLKVGKQVNEKLKHKLDAATENTDRREPNRLKGLVLEEVVDSDCDPAEENGIAKTPSRENLVGLIDDSAQLPSFVQHMWSQIFKRFLYAKLHWKTTLIQLLGPLLVMFLIIYLQKRTEPDQTESPPLTLSLEPYKKSAGIISIANKMDIAEEIASSYRSVIHDAITMNTEKDNFESEVNDTRYKNPSYFNRHVLSGIQIWTEDGVTHARAWFNNKGFHLMPLALALVDTAIYKYVNGNPSASLTFVNHPLPKAPADVEEESKYVAQDMIILTVVLVAGTMVMVVNFLVASFVMTIVKERETRGKHIQVIAGLNYPTYWLAAFLCDWLWFLICCSPMLIALAIYPIEGLSESDMLGRFFALFLFYGVGMLWLIYAVSFMFSSPNTAFSVISTINAILGIAAAIAISIVTSLPTEDLKDTLEWIFVFIPNYCLAIGVYRFVHKQMTCSHCGGEAEKYSDECSACSASSYFRMEDDGAGQMLIGLVLTAILSWLIVLLMEEKILPKIWLQIMKFVNKKRYTDLEMRTLEEDDDVAEERRRILNSSEESPELQDHLVLRNLTKYYNRFLAVNNLCLGVPKEECFGLLGVNGAGKTSAFKMLTGDELITEGDAYVVGHSCTREMKKVHKKIGYCPQFDAIIEDLTGYENIQLFSRIHGVKEAAIESICKNLATGLNFEEHLYKLSGSYSGGNKRKLSAALALVGNPEVVFLDEPTTGMDPLAKRLFWDIISEIRTSGRSVILTSHSMEECEALCTKLAIMVNGQFKCLGSCQHLKSKFGKGFTIIAKVAGKPEQVQTQVSVESTSSSANTTRARRQSSLVNPAKFRRQSSVVHRLATDEDIKNVKNFIETTFTGAILKESHEGTVTYQIDNPDITWAQLFQALEENKEALNIENYSVGQTTLEQVFLGFAKHQIVKEAKC